MKMPARITVLLLFPAIMYAQELNGEFEDWVVVDTSRGTEMPVGWMGSGFGVGKSNTAHTGEHALSVWNWYSYALGYIMTGGKGPLAWDLTHAGVPIDFTPTRLTGYYRYELGQRYSWSGEEDSAAVYVLLKRYNAKLKVTDTISRVMHLLPPSAEWIPFSINLPLSLPAQPDSVVVAFYSSNPENGATCGPDSSTCCYLSVDDVALTSTSGVPYALSPFLAPVSVVPNPVTAGAAVLRFEAIDGERYRVTVSDITGRLVLERDVVGSQVDLSGLDLPSGSYCVSVVDRTRASVAAGRFIVE